MHFWWGGYETVAAQKRGTLFIEARIRDDMEEVDVAKVGRLPFAIHLLICSPPKIQRHLERELSRPNQVYKLFADLLVDEFSKPGFLLAIHLVSRHD